MSKDLNQCNFIGRLGQDVETRYLPSGVAVSNFSMACGDDYKDKNTGQKVEQTNWVKVVMFGRLAEIASEYLKKGSQVYVSGKYTVRTYDDKNGQKAYAHEIKAAELQMLDSRGGASSDSAAPSNSAPAAAPAPDADFDDDIPF